MQTRIASRFKHSPAAQAADRILRACVHCGFCNATCPTYQLLGDELDGPRGRIYQIKGLFEGEQPATSVQTHLDRCLTCLNCQTTCPSGVEYGKLLDLGREFIEHNKDYRIRRPTTQRLLRWSLRKLLPNTRLFGLLMGIGRSARPLLPTALKQKISPRQHPGPLPTRSQPRRMLMLSGCVQPSLTPATNAAAIRVLDHIGITVQPLSGCCGAVSQHLSANDQARRQIRRNIDAWWPALNLDGEQPAEAIIITASGCGVMIKDYGYLLADDPDYADKAAHIAALAKDLSEVINSTDLAPLAPANRKPIAFHPPCTLQHGQRLAGRVEALLTTSGWQLLPVNNTHLCCGSAGTYSILQPTLSNQLREQKLTALQQHQPQLIATANVGCQTHLQAASEVPVLHWIELFDPLRRNKSPHDPAR